MAILLTPAAERTGAANAMSWHPSVLCSLVLLLLTIAGSAPETRLGRPEQALQAIHDRTDHARRPTEHGQHPLLELHAQQPQGSSLRVHGVHPAAVADLESPAVAQPDSHDTDLYLDSSIRRLAYDNTPAAPDVGGLLVTVSASQYAGCVVDLARSIQQK